MHEELREKEGLVFGLVTTDLTSIKSYFFCRVRETSEIEEMVCEMSFLRIDTHEPTFTNLLLIAFIFPWVYFFPFYIYNTFIKKKI